MQDRTNHGNTVDPTPECIPCLTGRCAKHCRPGKEFPPVGGLTRKKEYK